MYVGLVVVKSAVAFDLLTDVFSNCCAILPSTGAAGMQEKTLFMSQLFTHYVECRVASDWRFCIVSTRFFSSLLLLIVVTVFTAICLCVCLCVC